MKRFNLTYVKFRKKPKLSQLFEELHFNMRLVVQFKTEEITEDPKERQRQPDLFFNSTELTKQHFSVNSCEHSCLDKHPKQKDSQKTPHIQNLFKTMTLVIESYYSDCA